MVFFQLTQAVGVRRSSVCSGFERSGRVVMPPSKVATTPMREAQQSTVRCLTLIDVPS